MIYHTSYLGRWGGHNVSWGFYLLAGWCCTEIHAVRDCMVLFKEKSKEEEAVLALKVNNLFSFLLLGYPST